MRRRLVIPIALALIPLAVTIPESSAGAALECFGQEVNVPGTEGNDTIDLTDGTHGSGPFVVATLGGADQVIGSDGDDIVCLGDGDDSFDGGSGNDRALGGYGADILSGGPGHDELRGNQGADQLDGGPGDDLLAGGGGDDFIAGGDGDDRIRGKSGNDRLLGQGDDDEIRGNGGADHIDGGPGDDLVRGGPGDDRLNGGDVSSIPSGVDELRGGRGFDRLWSDWSWGDGDNDSVLRGGRDYDACANGAVRQGCERTHYQASSWSAAREEWRELTTEVLALWGLDEEACDEVNFEEHCVGPQIEQALDIIVCESWGFPFAVSSSGTAGLFQHRPQYFADRVASAQAESWVDFDWLADPNAFDPEVNIMVAAYLVWRSREVQLGHIDYAGYDHPNSSPPYYTSNWAKGPDPWGHWSCGDPGHRHFWDPAWIHPSFDGV